METGTFAMADKMASKEAIETGGAILLNTPVSGTDQQTAIADLVTMVSGPEAAIEQA